MAASIFWLMIGAYTAIHGYQLGLGRLSHPGPGFIFFVCALALIILGVANLAETHIGKSKKDEQKETYLMWRGVRWRKVLLVLAGLSTYAYIFDIAGFLLSTFLLMVFLYKVVEPTKWWIAIIGSLITVLFSYTVFLKGLRVPFPTGFLGF
jgi:putative tricarboxylic transport membrane protein